MESRMTIAGNLTKDPQLRIGRQSGQPFAVLAVAVNNRRQDKESGQWVTTGTTFFDVLCWRDTGANALLSLKKGDPVIVHGRFRLNEWSNETRSGANATIDADAVGPDISFGTAPFARGSAGYGLDRVADFDPGQEQTEEDLAGMGQYADEDGVVSDEDAAAILRRSGSTEPSRQEEDAAA